MSSGHTYPWHRWVGLAIAVFSAALLVTFFCGIGETSAAKQALDLSATPMDCIRSIAGSSGTDGLVWPGTARFVGPNTLEVTIKDVDQMKPADRPPADRVRCRVRFEKTDDDPKAVVVSAEWVR